MPDWRDADTTRRLSYCGMFVFFRVNPIACLPPWTIQIFFFIIIMNLAMTLKPFVFKTLENVSCYDLLNNGCKEDAEFLSHRLKIFTLISLQQRHNLNYKLGFEL